MLPTSPGRKNNATAVALAREIAQPNQDTLHIQKLLTLDDSLKKLVSVADGRWVDAGLKSSIDRFDKFSTVAMFCSDCGKPKQGLGVCEACGSDDTPPPPPTAPTVPPLAPPTSPKASMRLPSRAAFIAPGARVPSRNNNNDSLPSRPKHEQNGSSEDFSSSSSSSFNKSLSKLEKDFSRSNLNTNGNKNNEKKGGDYSSQSVASLDPLPPSRDRPKFSTMTNDFPAMMTQAQAGLKQITAMKEMLTRLVKMEQDNAKRMEKALIEESQRMNKIQESDGIILFSGVWTELIMALNEKVECSKQASERIVEEIIDPLNTLEKTSTMSLKSITTAMKTHEQDLKKVVDSMNKSKETCRKSLTTMQECLEKEKIEVNPKKRLELGDKTVAARKQAAENANTVVTKISDANRANEYFASGVRNCIDQLEELETQRITQLTTRLDKWMTLLKDSDEQQMQHSESAVNVVREINPDHCIQTYIFDWMIDFGNPSGIEPYVYDLPLTVNEIQAGNVLTKGFQMFNLPLTQLLEKEKNPTKDLSVSTATMLTVMQHQERTGKPLDVPLIMHVLCEAIKTMGGYKTPAIFRISIDAQLLADLQRQFDSGNFGLEQMRADPHAPACLLKLWLRSLTEPIIHSSLYKLATQGLQEMKSQAVAVRRETRIQLGPRASLAPTARLPASKAPDSQGHVMSVFAKLAPPYQALARRIAILARDVVAHAEINQMSYDSLAVVFAPTFFRTPKPDDPTEGIQQSHREKLFVMEFFIAIAQQAEAGNLK